MENSRYTSRFLRHTFYCFGLIYKNTRYDNITYKSKDRYNSNLKSIDLYNGQNTPSDHDPD